MATAQEHKARALHNEELLPVLEQLDTHPDWYITTAFYAAVHWLRALLAQYSVGLHEADGVAYHDFSRHFHNTFGRDENTLAMLKQFNIIQGLSYESRYRIRSKHWYDQRLHEADTSLKAVRQYAQTKGLVL